MEWLEKVAIKIEGEIKCEKCGGVLRISEELSKENDIVFICSTCGNNDYSYGVISDEEKMEFARQMFGRVNAHIETKGGLCN
ncbi:MAG TPA: hypothetical protein DDY52_03225 [Candidatus Moranbacteria bacterium]|nr:hypothetical protein [Candidatus Moranbacteria bacterium]